MESGQPQRRCTAHLAAVGLAAMATVSATLGYDLIATALGVSLIAVLGALCHPRAGSPADTGADQALRVHLARVRRRGEPADFLVVPIREEAPVLAHRLRSTLRVTDSSYLTRVGGCWELHAIVDRHRLERDGLQDRLSAAAGRELEIGWARFPEDGFTLGALALCARATVATVPLPAPGAPVDAAELFPAPLAAPQPQGAGQ